MQSAILVVDTGSSSMRGILFTPQGRLLHTEQRKYTMTVRADNAATMDAGVFSTSLTAICRACAAWAAEENCGIEAISFTSARSSVLPVSRDGEPLHPVLMWYDKRCTSLCASLPPQTVHRIYQLCGMRLTPVCSAPKMQWLRQQLPDVYNRADKLIGIHDYLLFLASGQMVTDASCACRTALMDIHTFDWSDELLSLFSLDCEKLLPIVRSGSVVGHVTERFHQATGLPIVPVISAGGDQGCCILGQGLTEADILSVNSGSASYITIPTKIPFMDPVMEINLTAYTGDFPWILEASNMGSGTLYQWFNHSFYQVGNDSEDLSQINAEVAAEPAGCNGLMCFADFAGRGCPDTDPEARGTFFGIGLQHTRASFARALLEGICFDICWGIDHLIELGVKVSGIQSTGGLTNFHMFNQILADVSGKEVRVCRQAETTARGAFLLALQALGRQAAAPQAQTDIYIPDPATHACYLKMKEKRQAVFARRIREVNA